MHSYRGIIVPIILALGGCGSDQPKQSQVDKNASDALIIATTNSHEIEAINRKLNRRLDDLSAEVANLRENARSAKNYIVNATQKETSPLPADIDVQLVEIERALSEVKMKTDLICFEEYQNGTKRMHICNES